MQGPTVNNKAPSTTPSHKSVTSSKKSFEKLWSILLLAITVASGVLFKKIYTYQSSPEFDSFRKGDFNNVVFYALPFSFAFTIFDLMVHYFFDEPCEKYYIDHQAYKDPIARKKRSYTLVKWGYSFIYYALSSLAAFLIIKNTSYFPKFFWGQGGPENIFQDFPENSQCSFEMEVFYILQLGKHFSRLISHLFIKVEGNYYEYALHHGLSVFLILFSYTMDMWLIGTCVLLAHDGTDFFLIFARGYKDFRYRSKAVLNFSFGLALVTWVASRVIFFGYAFIYCFWMGFFNTLSEKFVGKPFLADTFYYPEMFMGLMLLALWIMQLFWTYFIVVSAYAGLVKNDLNKAEESESRTYSKTSASLSQQKQ